MKIVFLTGNLVQMGTTTFRFLEQRRNDDVEFIVGDFILPKKTTGQSIKIIIEKAGYRYFLFKVFETVLYEILSKINKFITWNPAFVTVKECAAKYNLPCFTTKNFNSPETVNLIRKLQPDLIISIAPQILKSEVIRIPRLGIINLHPALLPEYRGLGPYFWPLYNNEKKAGATVHFIDEGIDTGPILNKTEFPILESDTPHTLYWKISVVGADLLLKTVKEIEENRVHPVKQDEGKKYSWPSPADISRYVSRKKRLMDLRGVIETLKKDCFKGELL